jgi:hypothetical protein
LWLYLEKEAEKIPMGFDSEESFAEMDEDGNMTNGIRVEVKELKPVEIKKSSEERARGEGQTPFGKMEKCDDFIYIFHGKRFVKRRAPVDKTLVLKQTLRNKFVEIVVGALTVSPPQTAAATLSSSHPSRWISWAPFLGPLATSCSGAAEKGVKRFGWIGVL